MQARSATEVVAFSQRLLHDLQVFFSVSRSLVRKQLGISGPLPWDMETALIESFGLHARALTDFFFTRKQGRGKHDAFAFHFFEPHMLWLNVMPDQGPWLRQVRMRATRGGGATVDRFGTQIAHLSFQRTPPSDYARGWPVMQVANEVGHVLHCFLQHVDESKVCEGFIPQALREIPVIARLDDSLQPMAAWTRPAIRPALNA